MDAFGDDFTNTPPEEVNSGFGDDPAADFLAREQEELGDLGEELGLANGNGVGADNDGFFAESADVEITDPVAEMRLESSPSPQMFLSHPKPKEEPESIRKWREDYARQLEEKDQRETEQMEELRNQAKKELSDWYRQNDEKLAKTKVANRESEKEFVADVDEISPGTEWDRVSKLCDFNAKSNRHTKDMSRMRSIMLQLKQNPPVKNAA